MTLFSLSLLSTYSLARGSWLWHFVCVKWKTLTILHSSKIFSSRGLEILNGQKKVSYLTVWPYSSWDCFAISSLLIHILFMVTIGGATVGQKEVLLVRCCRLRSKNDYFKYSDEHWSRSTKNNLNQKVSSVKAIFHPTIFFWNKSFIFDQYWICKKINLMLMVDLDILDF